MKVIIIGGGLVGSLAAVFLSQKDHDVELFEFRQDPRKTNLSAGRSINLALSERGQTALRAVGLEKKILQIAIPMGGRMIHKIDGSTSPILYDPVLNKCIYSVGRKQLNDMLLDEAEKSPKVRLHFGMKLLKVDAPSGSVKLITSDGITKEIKGDLIIGADGAHSTVRRDLMKATPITFSQTYIDHGYLELSIPPEQNGKMAPNHLHIWPRGKFMMIALPNLDGSWTVTLFMPLSSFATLRDSKDVLGFFRTHFPDAIDLIGESGLVGTFMANEASHLVSIKCSKYNYGSVVIIGDAAHAMVPFFGQGMNAGFEDCTILNDLLHDQNYSTIQALEVFSFKRKPDAEAICDLAMYNYVEMRDLVNKKVFLVRKTVDNLLYRIAGSKWTPLYQSVTFTNMRYGQCLKNKKRQDSVIKMMTYMSVAAIVAFLATFLLPKMIVKYPSNSTQQDYYCSTQH